MLAAFSADGEGLIARRGLFLREARAIRGCLECELALWWTIRVGPVSAARSYAAKCEVIVAVVVNVSVIIAAVVVRIAIFVAAALSSVSVVEARWRGIVATIVIAGWWWWWWWVSRVPVSASAPRRVPRVAHRDRRVCDGDATLLCVVLTIMRLQLKTRQRRERRQKCAPKRVTGRKDVVSKSRI